MVTKQQRARQLARAKWERQQTRRNTRGARLRRLAIAGWAVFGLAVAGLVVWFGATQLGNSPAPAQSPILPGLTNPPTFQAPNYSPPATQTAPTGTTPTHSKPTSSASDRGQQ
ncbi:MAG: hypothetical protein ABJA86_00110 [Nocardioidaceae bacterium]